MNKEEFFKEITQKFEKMGIEIEESQKDQLFQYMKLLIEWNEKMNLTAIIEPKEIILKHFVDSITINKYIKDYNRILDMGTGAGFPGIPLKIINPEKEFILADSLNKRINFLNEVCEQLKLKHINCIHTRAEELAYQSLYREKCDVVTSRAVARLNTLVEYMLPFTKIEGKCICMKGPNMEEELIEATKAIEVLGGEIRKVENLLLPDSNIERNIVVIEKINGTPKKYPRKSGTPTKQPIT